VLFLNHQVQVVGAIIFVYMTVRTLIKLIPWA